MVLNIDPTYHLIRSGAVLHVEGDMVSGIRLLRVGLLVLYTTIYFSLS